MHALTLLAALPLVLAQDTCYYPEGNEPTDYKYIPCNGVNTTFSQCCLLDDGDQCLPNGLCYYGKKKYDYRAACSDKSWETCADACPSLLQDAWINVKACATDEFCCNEDIDNGDCCKDGGERFDLPAPSVSTSASSSSTTSEPSSSTESSAPSSTEEGANPQSPNPSDPNPQNPEDNNSSGGLSTGAQGAIGGSIGGVALIAIAGAAFFFIRRRKSKKAVPAAELGGQEKKGYWGGETQGPQWQGQQWQGSPAEVEGSSVPIESGGREVPHRYELGG